MNARTDELVRQGLAERQDRGITFSRNLIDTLRRREVQALARSSPPRPGVRTIHPHPANMSRAITSGVSRSRRAASP